MVLKVEQQTGRGWRKVGEVSESGKWGFIRFSEGNSEEGLIFGLTADNARSIIYRINIEEGAWLIYRQDDNHSEIEGLQPFQELLPGQEVILPTEEIDLPLGSRYRFTHVQKSHKRE